MNLVNPGMLSEGLLLFRSFQGTSESQESTFGSNDYRVAYDKGRGSTRKFLTSRQRIDLFSVF
jgi:hypothetical protein